jgi:hypothetical protein
MDTYWDSIFTAHSSHHHWSLVVGRVLPIKVGRLSSFLDHELSNDDQWYCDGSEYLMMSAIDQESSEGTHRSSKYEPGSISSNSIQRKSIA